MHSRHVPGIDRRYWCGILFASIFGTNLGDFYAHESGLGIGLGVALLAVLFGLACVAETRDRSTHETYYWLAIIIIRTGATNIADYLAFRLRIPALLLVAGLAALIAGFAWRGNARAPATPPGGAAQPRADACYWAAMLAAGVFGTVLGDVCSHHFGQAPSAIVLGAALLCLLTLPGGRAATRLPVYWCAVALARTAGTCMGDWLAENHLLHLGLPLSTLLTGIAFAAILTLWRGPRSSPPVAA